MSRQQKKIDPAAVEGDFFRVKDLLSDQERRTLDRVRAFLAEKVEPTATELWARAESPLHLVDAIRELNITGLPGDAPGVDERGPLLNGLISMEMARTDPSFATFYGVHSGLGMGSIRECGSDEQRERWLPEMARWTRIGAFALTEPLVGSATAGGLLTTARREGDTWVLNGEKKWIGNATFADLVVVWAHDEADGQVKGFVVEKGTPGFTARKLEGKIALRGVQNAHIVLDDVRVPEDNRLQRANSFRDTARVLKVTRGGVAWFAIGCSIGAYEAARAYAVEREQFGRPIASFQLVQDLLSRMLGNITACQAMAVRMAALQAEDRLSEAQAAMAKMFCTTRMRETVAWGREIFGGNGILLEHKAARFFADAEALYSYEGTRDMNSLIVGRAATGFSAFV
ncbi:glutaryl-CoA dehydrogenase [Streptoalloteichus tenebrarius]|uniref:Glutaryl-CoA dehydrogenase n=1 Tax=Streptoalloteichus tenebrarius (strain ATCC 17920 / DSM 40477 / JCM 4838 / CBS 697.72 / NBRC 16177 / NCIMB 11028 / NRRL B-12390 / A12253. 1 / ISP 5477) TaxID=1933 RepID=A0ABT1HWG3_STRSD|nr:acyl-CoA dehydrogenase family protein [Streptoalloteichus tenebrarius]MCP2259836.1 glutaryl-CoA dehydrogenase [Streptoalloteichus tenebrarius]BFE99214.1 acyl-CoA dehydrogenase family protein [Streptoalloteichus tenebrarius]